MPSLSPRGDDEGDDVDDDDDDDVNDVDDDDNNEDKRYLWVVGIKYNNQRRE